jgi:hypothetical protein
LTGIIAYLDNVGTLETAQHLAAHESPRTTKLCDRRQDEITLDEPARFLKGRGGPMEIRSCQYADGAFLVAPKTEVVSWPEANLQL